MNPLTVPCPLCKVPAGFACVNVIDGSPRDPPDVPHHSRYARAAKPADSLLRALVAAAEPRDIGYSCERCDRLILRAEAYTDRDDVFLHVDCTPSDLKENHHA
jgi:hypothetical protein